MGTLNNSNLIDPYQRKINYLRLSITDRCNLRCIYCMPFEAQAKLSHKDILRYEEILHLVKIAVRAGICKVRVTGGEPLIRKGVYDFLCRLSNIEGLNDISLTTNGVLVKENLKKIQSAGIKRINFSLDTLDRTTFKRITGFDVLDNVWNSILAAHSAGFKPIKINVVALRGINEDELLDMARLTFKYPFHIRFIEQMPIGLPRFREKQPLLADDIKSKLIELGKLIPIKQETQFAGPAQRFKFEGSQGEIGFIQPLSHHFCSECNRLRLTANGKLRACLLHNRYIDLKHPLRSGCSDQELLERFYLAVLEKPRAHQLQNNHPHKITDQMHSIGG